MASRPAHGFGAPVIHDEIGRGSISFSRNAAGSPSSRTSEQQASRQYQSVDVQSLAGEPPTPSLSFVTARSIERPGLMMGGNDTLEALPQLPRSTYLEIQSASSTRPSTASSSGNHAPSVRLGAFSKPMSSQRLQAHRAVRPTSLQVSQRGTSLDSDEMTNATNRDSTGSALTSHVDHNFQPRFDSERSPPLSNDLYPADWAVDRDAQPYSRPLENNNSGMQRAQGSPFANHEESTMQKQDIERANGWTQQSAPKHGNLSRPAVFTNFGHFSRSPSGRSRNSGLEKLPSRENSPQPTRQDRFRVQSSPPTARRNWEYSESNLVFCFNGRFLNSRKRPVVLITWFLVVFPSAMYFIFTAPYLWHHTSPAIPILYAYVFFLCISSLLHASVSDPGIYPRNLHAYPSPSPNDDPLALGPPTTDWTQVRSAKASYGVYEVPTKYCKTCNMWRPPRCHHCRLCDSCIDTQDHHCMWLNNCVGRRNYRYFFSFVTSTSVLAIWLMGSSIAAVTTSAKQYNISFSRALAQNYQNGVSFFLFLYGLLGFGYPTALCVYHIHLMMHAQTTREVLTSRNFLKKDRHRPFDQNSWWKNIFVVLMRPRPPAYMEFKKMHVDGDQRLGPDQHHQNTPSAALWSWIQVKLNKSKFSRKPSDQVMQSQISQASNPGHQGLNGLEMRNLGGRKTGGRGPLSGIFRNNTPRV